MYIQYSREKNFPTSLGTEGMIGKTQEFQDDGLDSGQISARNVLAKTERCLSSTDQEVLGFVGFVIRGILSENRVRADIERRIRSGSGHQACRQSHEHSESCQIVYGTELIKRCVEVTSTDSRSINEIISKASSTWLNVIARGERDNAGPMDAATAKFIRRQILTETIVRTVVSQIQDEHMNHQARKSKDGFLFALPQTLKEKFSNETDRFEELISRIPPVIMSDIMNKGYGLIPDFTTDVSLCWRELERIDAMGLFGSAPSGSHATWWTTIETLAQNKPPYTATASVCENLSYIPFELNAKHKGLMVQVVENFQLMLLESDKSFVDFPTSFEGLKFLCLVPFTQAPDIDVSVRILDETVSVPCGSLLIVDAKKCKISIGKSSFKRFIVSVYLTGPS